MFGITFAAPLLAVKAGSYWVKYADENQLGNRLFGFWLGNLGNDRSKALDVRIYRQDILSSTYLKNITRLFLHQNWLKRQKDLWEDTVPCPELCRRYL